MLKGLKGTRIRGRAYWAALLVLFMLAVRALVPAGFMLAPVEGRLSFVLCEPDVLGGPQSHSHHHHHAGHDAAGHSGSSHGDVICPYAQSAGPAPLRALPALAAAVVIVEDVPPAIIHQVSLRSGPLRHQSPRGPPTLA